MPKRAKTPLETLLADNGDREKLIDAIDNRVESIKSQLNTRWMKQRIYMAQMNDDFSWRRGDKGNSNGARDPWFGSEGLEDWGERIFDLQNDSLNIVGGFAAFMAARTTDDSFGTEPSFNIFPEGPMDKIVAEAMQRHAEWKIRRSPWKDAAIDAIDLAIGIGEGVIKQSWERAVDTYETRKTVLFDAGNKKPYTTADGQFIYPDDARVGQSDDNPEGIQAVNVNGVNITAMVFEKDPMNPVNVAGIMWKEMEIEETNITYNNIRANVLHFEDFLCAENEGDINEADFVAHRIQRRLSYLIDKYGLDEETINLFKTDTYDPKTAQAKPNQDSGEQAENYSQYENPDPWIELHECWMKFDPKGDGKLRRMMVLYAQHHRVIIKMDYIANITPDGRIPFDVIRAFRVKNRWWGRGYYEIYEKAQEFVDRHLNYIAYRNRFHSNPVVVYDDSVLVSDEESEEFQFKPGASYRKKPGTKMEDLMQTLELPDLDERTWQLMQMMIQIIQVRSGVTSAAQGQVSDLPSSSTATGIESILQSASTLARMPMNEMKRGLEKSLLYAIKLIHANLDPEETYNYFEGDMQQFGVLMAETVQSIDVNVKLLMTRFRQREALDAAKTGIEIGQSYIQLPEPEKLAQRPLYVQAIKSLGFNDANSIIRQPITQQPGIDPATGQPLALPDGQQPEPPPRPPTPAEAPTPAPPDPVALAKQAINDPEAGDDHKAAARRVLAANGQQ